jgi:uncharacterized protein
MLVALLSQKAGTYITQSRPDSKQHHEKCLRFSDGALRCRGEQLVRCGPPKEWSFRFSLKEKGSKVVGNADLLRGLYDAFGRGDMETVLGSMDASISWRQAEGNPYNMDGGPWVGPNAVAENLFMKLGTEWDGFTVTPARFSEAGDRVVVEGRYTGTYKATGKSIDAQFCHVWDIQDGKLMAFQQYMDTAQLQSAM